MCDAPPSSSKDLTTTPKVTIVKGERVGAHYLARNTLGVEGHAGASRWD
jgi:hypothetical protein